MGVTIKCERTGKSYDMGCGGFCNLRKKVAELANAKFSELYEELTRTLFLREKEFYDEWDRKLDQLLKTEKGLSSGIVDFCLQSDIEGKINHRTCRLIYNVVKDYDDNIIYGYAAHPDAFRFRDFKGLLEDCIRTKSPLFWF